jgi:membrane fusion protein, multidrug efflux system
MGAVSRVTRSRIIRPVLGALIAASLLSSCGKEEKPEAKPQEVTVLTVEPSTTPVALEFIGQTESSRMVEIRARVSGFLDRISYKEGTLVRSGQTLFVIDRKPFAAQLQQAQGQYDASQARLQTTTATEGRVRPLAEQNAASKRDLDVATGNMLSAKAAADASKGQLDEAKLNLGYCTVQTPVTGLSSSARYREGSYVSPGDGGLLTYVAQLDPIWVNFSVSENEILKFRDEGKAGTLIFPVKNNFEVELILADGAVFPNRGRINFADPSYNTETGTFVVRADLRNPDFLLRPGQFVRVRLLGAVRPDAVLVPQTAVMQGAKGNFVWVIREDGTAEQRFVDAGDWYGKNWFIRSGLKKGERVAVTGTLRLAAGVKVKVAGEEKLALEPASGAPAGGGK